MLECRKAGANVLQTLKVQLRQGHYGWNETFIQRNRFAETFSCPQTVARRHQSTTKEMMGAGRFFRDTGKASEGGYCTGRFARSDFGTP